jgi:hypothetical protein
MQGQDLSQAKAYCVNGITQTLAPQFFTVLNSLFELGKSAVPASQQSPWRTFQESLRDIPTWNQRLISEQTNRALAACPQLEKLVATAMMCQASQLANVRGIALQTKDMPRIGADRFVHDAYVRAAQELVHNPLLFGQSGAELVVQNREKVIATITQCLVATIDSYVPLDIIMSKAPQRLPVNSSHAAVRKPNRKPPHSLGAYETDTFDSAQEPSLLMLDNDAGAEPLEETSVDETAAPLVVTVTTPLIKDALPQPPAPLPEQSFIYAPSTLGSKLSYTEAKRILNQTIA